MTWRCVKPSEHHQRKKSWVACLHLWGKRNIPCQHQWNKEVAVFGSRQRKQWLASHRTLILRVERTVGLNATLSSWAGLPLAWWWVYLRLSVAGLLSTDAGLNRETRLTFDLCRGHKQMDHHANKELLTSDQPHSSLVSIIRWIEWIHSYVLYYREQTMCNSLLETLLQLVVFSWWSFLKATVKKV